MKQAVDGGCHDRRCDRNFHIVDDDRLEVEAAHELHEDDQTGTCVEQGHDGCSKRDTKVAEPLRKQEVEQHVQADRADADHQDHVAFLQRVEAFVDDVVQAEEQDGPEVVVRNLGCGRCRVFSERSALEKELDQVRHQKHHADDRRHKHEVHRREPFFNAALEQVVILVRDRFREHREDDRRDRHAEDRLRHVDEVLRVVDVGDRPFALETGEDRADHQVDLADRNGESDGQEHPVELLHFDPVQLLADAHRLVRNGDEQLEDKRQHRSDDIPESKRVRPDFVCEKERRQDRTQDDDDLRDDRQRELAFGVKERLQHRVHADDGDTREEDDRHPCRDLRRLRTEIRIEDADHERRHRHADQGQHKSEDERPLEDLS